MVAIRFGTSGWRAVLAEEFTFGNARRVIAAIGRTLDAEGHSGGLVLVGYDTRFLAGRFAAEAARILRAAGFQAEMSSRPIPTPVLAFEIRRRGAVGGVNFTASHNPPQYLGIKFSTSDGAPSLPAVTSRWSCCLCLPRSEPRWQRSISDRWCCARFGDPAILRRRHTRQRNALHLRARDTASNRYLTEPKRLA